VVRAGAHLGDNIGRPGLEFPVFDDGKVDASDIQCGIVDADTALDGRGVVGVGQVGGLCKLDFVHVLGRHDIAAVGRAGKGGFDAFFAP